MLDDKFRPLYLPPVQEAEGVAELVDSALDVLEAAAVEVELLLAAHTAEVARAANAVEDLDVVLPSFAGWFEGDA